MAPGQIAQMARGQICPTSKWPRVKKNTMDGGIICWDLKQKVNNHVFLIFFLKSKYIKTQRKVVSDFPDFSLQITPPLLPDGFKTP